MDGCEPMAAERGPTTRDFDPMARVFVAPLVSRVTARFLVSRTLGPGLLLLSILNRHTPMVESNSVTHNYLVFQLHFFI